MFDRILVPLDGSKAAEVALEVAAQLPGRHLQLVDVDPDCTDHSDLCTGARDRERYLESVAMTLRQDDRDVTTMVAFGNPVDQITALARAADLIVMSSHGRGAMARLLFGSVADSVALSTPTPSLIIRGDEWDATALKRIVVPLDGLALAEQSLPVAASLAREMHLPLHLIRVVDFDLVAEIAWAGLSAATACGRQQDELEREAEAYLAMQSTQYQSQDCVVTSEVLTGYPVGGLLASIQPEDLVVVATHARGGISRWWIGSVAEEMIRHGAGPVLLVRDAVETLSAQPEEAELAASKGA